LIIDNKRIDIKKKLLYIRRKKGGDERDKGKREKERKRVYSIVAK